MINLTLEESSSNWTKVAKFMKLFLLSAFLLLASTQVKAQCDVANFTATPVAGDCSNNNKIQIAIPGGVTCTGLKASLLNAAGTTTIQGPIDIVNPNGSVEFNTVAPGNYKVVITDGVTTFGPKDVTVTTNYVQLNYTFVATAPTCNPLANQYTPNGTVKITIPPGVGKAPFIYKIVSPTAGTVTTAATNALTHTFTGLGNNETQVITVTDACGTEITNNPKTGDNSFAKIPDLIAAYFVRDCAGAPGDCTKYNLAVRLRSGNPFKTIITGTAEFSTDGGTTWVPMTPQTFLAPPYFWSNNNGPNWLGFTTSAVFSPGQTVKIRTLDECQFLTKDFVVPPVDDVYLNAQPFGRIVNCVPSYAIKLDAGKFVSGQPGGNLYTYQFCPFNTTVEVKRETSPGSGVYVQESILTNQNLLDTNPTEPPGYNDIRGVDALLRGYLVKTNFPGNYQVVVSDACHTVTKNVVVALNEAPLVAFDSFGVYEGTGAFGVKNLKANEPLTVTINTVPAGQTFNISSGPFSYATPNPRTISFPQTFSFTPSPNKNISFADLPPATYEVSFLDACGITQKITHTVTKTATYTPVVTKKLSCINSNTLEFTMNPGIDASNAIDGITLVKNVGGVPQAAAEPVNITRSTYPGYGTVTVANIPSGSYFLKIRVPGFASYDGSEQYGAMYGSIINNQLDARTMYIPVDFPPVKTIDYTIRTGMCNPTTGFIEAQLAEPSEYVYPMTFSVYNVGATVGVTPPVAVKTAADETQSLQAFNNLPAGDYFMVITDGCSSVQKAFTLNNTPIVPVFKQFPANPICLGASVEISLENVVTSAYTFEWRDAANNIVGTDPILNVVPTLIGNNIYTLNLTVKNDYCIGGLPIVLSTTVTVSPSPTLTLAVSDVNFCKNPANPGPYNVTISNAQAGFTYEIVDQLGASFAPAITGVGTGANLVLSIPAANVPAAGVNYSVKVSSGGSCTGTLTDLIQFTGGNANLGLAVTSNSPVCAGTSATLNVALSEVGIIYQVLQNGVALAPNVTGNGNGGNLALVIPNPVNGAVYSIAASGSSCTTGVLTQTITMVVKPNLTKVGTETAICAASGTTYTLTVVLSGTGPFTATGTGAPGTYVGNTWTSSPIASGTNYNVNFSGVNVCSALVVSGTSPDCCVFTVVCPTFAATTVECYSAIPTKASYTKAEFEALGGTINSSCGVIAISAANSADPGCSGVVTRTYTITVYQDTNLNGVRDAGEDTILFTKDCVQTINVADKTAPVFTGSLPGNITVSCDKVPAAATLTATDNCATPTVTFAEVRTAGSCANSYILTRTWTAADACGNNVKHVQVITVEDKTPPVFVGTLPQNLSVSCDQIPSIVTLTATDNCGNATVTVVETRTEGVCEENGYTITRTWTATDACGNTTIHKQTIVVGNNSPAINVEKVANVKTVAQVGDVVIYTIVVTNTGNVTLRNIKVVDPLTGMNETIAILLPGEKKTLTTRYTLKLSDFNTSTLINIVTATGTDPKGNPVKDDDQEDVGVEAPKFNIPNVITPNGDGKNDTFFIDGLEAFPDNNLIIFNRWNNEVFNSNGYYKNNWNAEGLNDGTYYYILKLKSRTGTSQMLKGTITVLRKN